MLVAVLALIGGTGATAVPDAPVWPQWRGPDRTGVSKETGLLSQWPQGGPKLMWTASNLGEGYSGPAIVGDRLYTMGMRGEEEYVLCYTVADGKERWAVRNGAAYHNDFGDGPRCTPTVDGQWLYALGASGDLCCLRAEDGKEKWRLNILKAFQGENTVWGISESPLVEGNMVIVTPGGTRGTMVALDKETGKTLWTSKDPSAASREEAGYASPIAYTVGGERQVATLTGRGGIGVRASDGRFLWRYDKMANSTANITTPIFHDGRIFFSSDYGAGCALLQLQPGGPATEVYFNKNLKNHHGGVVLVDGYLYGFDSNILVCMEWATGKVRWKDRSVGKGSLCYADGCLYALSESGTVGLVKATPDGYKELGRMPLPARSANHSWTHPVVVGGRLYLRDQDKLFCYDVTAVRR
jgi:outer membrane protein assembly factor BamB